MSLEYLEGYSNQGGSADVWILRDEGGKIIAFTMQIFHKLFIVCQHISAADVLQYNQKPDRFQHNRQKGKCYGKYFKG